MNRRVLSFCCALDSERELLYGSRYIVTAALGECSWGCDSRPGHKWTEA